MMDCLGQLDLGRIAQILAMQEPNSCLQIKPFHFIINFTGAIYLTG